MSFLTNSYNLLNINLNEKFFLTQLYVLKQMNMNEHCAITAEYNTRITKMSITFNEKHKGEFQLDFFVRQDK